MQPKTDELGSVDSSNEVYRDVFSRSPILRRAQGGWTTEDLQAYWDEDEERGAYGSYALARNKANSARLCVLYTQIDLRRLEGWKPVIEPCHVAAAKNVIRRSNESVLWYLRSTQATARIEYSVENEVLNGQTVKNSFVPLPDGTVLVPQCACYFHADWLGGSRFASRYSDRTMYNDLAYAPFGEQYATAGGTGVGNASFAGNRNDTTTNLYDAQFREYEIYGRWPSPDPAGLKAADPTNPQSWNRYAYVMNNPLRAADPTGLWCVWQDGTHDPDPEEGGATPDQCLLQGGMWDPGDTETGCDSAWNCTEGGSGGSGQTTQPCDPDDYSCIGNGFLQVTPQQAQQECVNAAYTEANNTAADMAWNNAILPIQEAGQNAVVDAGVGCIWGLGLGPLGEGGCLAGGTLGGITGLLTGAIKGGVTAIYQNWQDFKQVSNQLKTDLANCNQ